LRACPNKIGGIVLMGGALIILLFLPLLNQARAVNGIINPTLNFIIYIFFSIFLLLGWLGAQPVEQPYIFISQVCTFGYFCFFIVVLFLTLFFETKGAK
jgi:ubiquinol-cytochrome c reductase cytochrome b/c1 subunit